MWIAQTISQARRRRGALAGPVAFVATMGALHDGHMKLIRRAGQVGHDVVVSIFVNSAQFGPHEDYHRYPRPVAEDLALCRQAGISGVFSPSASEIYPPDQIGCQVQVPLLDTMLEGQCRPGHFAGVCRVVLKLLNILQPEVALFGQKDFQQWRVVAAVVSDLNLPVRIVACPTARDPDGLACSSRNRYLSAADRARALGLCKAIRSARQMVQDPGTPDVATIEDRMRQIMIEHELKVDYAAVRDPDSLQALDPALADHQKVVALVAGRVGGVRLIDSMLISRCRVAPGR